MKPIWFAAAAALLASLVARRHKLEKPVLAAGAVAAVGMVAYGAGVVEIPNLSKVLENIGQALGPWTYLLVAFLAFMEAAAFLGLIIPGETGIIVGGVVAGQGEINIIALIAIAWTAAFLGDMTGYALGRRLGRPFLLEYGPRFGLSRQRVEMAESFFARHGGKAIFIGRFVGIVRSLSPFLAGSSRMELKRFVPYEILGSGLQTTMLCLIGFFFWRSLDQVLALVKQGALALGATIAIIVAVVIAVRWIRNPENRSQINQWLDDHHDRRTVRLLAAAGESARRPASFLADRVTPGGRFGLEATTLLAVAGVASFVFFGNMIVLGDGVLTPGDQRGLDWSGAIQNAMLTEMARAISQLGSISVAGVALAVTSGVLIFRRHTLEGVALLIGFGVTVLGVELSQGIVERPAPAAGVSLDGYPASEGAYATVWVAIAVALRHALPRFSHRAVVLIAGVVLASLVALSTVYLGRDWFSDVAGGLGLGAFVFSGVGVIGLSISQLRRPG